MDAVSETDREKDLIQRCGVDIEKGIRLPGDQADGRIDFRPDVVTGWRFAGMRLQSREIQETILVSSTDGVGTKLKIAS